MNLDDQQITLDIVARELGIEIPEFVQEAVRRFEEIDSDSWCSLITPRVLLRRNLAQRMHDPVHATAVTNEMLIIGDDGYGNYYLIDTAHENAFRLWNHEINEIDEASCSFDEYVNSELAQLSPPDGEPFRWNELDQLVLHRTRVWRDSPLCPVQLNEWRSAVETVQGVVLREKMKAINPFTKEEVFFNRPGNAVINNADGDSAKVLWVEGHIVTSDVHQLVEKKFAELATILGCRFSRLRP